MPWSEHATAADDPNQPLENDQERLMDENKRKQIEAKLVQLFTQTDRDQNPGAPTRTSPQVIKVIRRRKGKPDLQVA